MAEEQPQMSGDQRAQLDFFSQHQRYFGSTICYLFADHITKVIAKQKAMGVPKQASILSIYSVIAALFSGSESLDSKQMAALMRETGQTPYPHLIESVASVQYTNYMAYLGGLYVVSLSKTELTKEDMFNIISVLKLHPDFEIIDKVIEIYQAVRSGDSRYIAGMEASHDPEYKEVYDSLWDMIAMNDYLVGLALKASMANELFRKNLSPKMSPYSYAVGAVVFSGKKLNRRDVTSVLEAMGVTPERELMDAVMSTNFKNQIAYVGSTYLLYRSGMDVTPESLLRISYVLGLGPDLEAAENNIAALNSMLAAKKKE